MTSSIMTLHLLPRKVTTLYGKQNGGSRKYQGLKMETEFMSGEEFLRSIEARLARMEEMANAFHDYQTDHFRRELEEKQLRASIAKTNASCNRSQSNGISENDEMAKLLKIYDPDREMELADVFRYREYSEELETVEEESFANYDNEDACDQELPEFTNGTKYLDWLKHQLPYIEPFQPQDETHYYFFRKWRKDDLNYYSEMESLDEIENEDDEDETHKDISDLSTSSNLKPVNDETKPEFDSGRQLVEWLGRRLAYLEPFAPTDAVHFYFKRRWSREKFVACLDVLEETETVEEKAEEQVNETPHIEPNHSLAEEIGTKFDEDACDLEFPEFINGTEYLDWLKHQLPNMG